MNEKQDFLQNASLLLIENGPKAVTMDDVAAAFGISKKTLYQMFRNKEALLEDILKYNLQRVISRLNNLDDQIDNAVERMFIRDHEIESISQSGKSVMIRHLLKYYPAIFQKHMLDFSEKFSQVLVKNIEKGRKQGYYHDDFDATIYSKIFFQLVMSYDSSPYIDTSEIDSNDYKEVVMMMYMNAITTEKGKETIKKIKNNR